MRDSLVSVEESAVTIEKKEIKEAKPSETVLMKFLRV